MKFALLTVTYGGLFYKGAALSVEQQIKKAKQLGFDALAIETKRPVASPIDLSRADRTRIKQVAADEGIELCAIESMSNFSGQYMEDRENNLAMMQQVLQLAKDLGVSLVKIFAAWPGILNDEGAFAQYAAYDRGNYFKPLTNADIKKWNRCIEGIREVAGWAADMGITLALQNHAPVLTPGYEDTLAMTNEIDRSNVKICLDVPLFFDRQRDDYVREAVRKCGEKIIYTHYGAWNFGETEEGEIIQLPAPGHGGRINYETFIEELVQIGYTGYLVSEYCLPILKDHTLQGIEAIDHATKISMQYIKQLVSSSILS